jgi:hypothetical protein
MGTNWAANLLSVQMVFQRKIINLLNDSVLVAHLYIVETDGNMIICFFPRVALFANFSLLSSLKINN